MKTENYGYIRSFLIVPLRKLWKARILVEKHEEFHTFEPISEEEFRLLEEIDEREDLDLVNFVNEGN